MSKTAQEHLENFIKAMSNENALFSDMKKFLTVTQQSECLYVGKVSVEGSLMGMHQVLKQAYKYEIKAKPSSNEVVKDFVIHLFKQEGAEHKKTEIQCRLIKQSGVREARVDGVWGVNSSSFKLLR